MSHLKSYERTLAPLPLEKFHLDRNLLASCASDLGIAPGVDFCEPLFDDAVDVGIAIRSPKSGRTMRFVLVRTDQEDGDIHGWFFDVYEPDSRVCPTVRHALVVND